MKKRILSTILAVILVAIMLPCTVNAANSSLFVDVPEDEYYAEAVAWAVKNNITSGTGNDTFSPSAACTRGQAVTFLWRAAGSPEPSSTANPFQDVSTGKYYYKAVLWAVEKDITSGTSPTTFSPHQTCSRAQIVTFQWRAAGKPAVAAGSSFSDVPANAFYAKAVAWAVQNGITSGSGKGTFRPGSPCTRAQIVTFLYRDRVPSANQKPIEPQEGAPATATSYEGLITGNTQLISWHDADDAEAAEQNVRYMLQHGMNTIQLTGHATQDEIKNGTFSYYSNVYMKAIKHYEEFGYNNVYDNVSASNLSGFDGLDDGDGPSIQLSGYTVTVTITFSNSAIDDATLARYREDALTSAIAVHDQLWNEGKITSSMSEREKAKVYFDWIVANCDYDFSFASTSHVSYGAFSLKKAVCEGYTGAYNLLLKLEGISCSTEMTDSHIWTTATLDGTFCHIDATWGDQNNVPANQYFAMTPEASWARFN